MTMYFRDKKLRPSALPGSRDLSLLERGPRVRAVEKCDVLQQHVDEIGKESKASGQLDESRLNHGRLNAGNRGHPRNTRRVDFPHKPSDNCTLVENNRLQENEMIDVRSDDKELHAVAELNGQELSNTTFRDDWKNEGRELPEEEYKITHGLHRQQQQASVVRWDRFLPQRQLRVLLAEYDDSTRHVVTALLHNCSYEVISVASGLKAWNLMEDPKNHFDLVLTEVMMPYLSGIDLLNKITANDAFNHIPVIMMSSHDSMGVVFKCLSKGAVDFLVKPVRKNELKNLWQHVWRRCHRPSGSGSRSGSQTEKALGARIGLGSDNNIGTSDESDNASGASNIHDGSDKGSGTQSSWTKRAVEIEGTVQKNAWDNAHPYFSPTLEFQVPKDYGTDQAMGQELQIATPRVTAVEIKYLKEGTGMPDSTHMAYGNTSSSTDEGKQMAMGNFGSREHSTKAIDLIGAMGCQNRDDEGESDEIEDAMDKGMINAPKSKDKSISDSNFLPTLELSLKRPRSGGEVDGDVEDRRVLKHSGSSAFSRYNTSSNFTQLPSPQTFPINMYPIPSGNGGNSFIQGSGIGTGNAGVVRFAIPVDRSDPSKVDGESSFPVPLLPQLSQNNGNDGNLATVGPGQDGTDTSPVKEEAVQVPPIPGSGMPTAFSGSGVLAYDGVSAAYGSMHSMFYSHLATPWCTTSTTIAGRGEAADQSSPKQSQVRPQDHHHSHLHSYHHHHHVQHHCHHHYQQSTNPSAQQQDEQTVTKFGSGTPCCGSSTIPESNNGQSGSCNGYGSNGNGHGCAVGSNNASNSHNAQSNAQSGTGLAAGGNGDIGTQNGNSGMGAGNCMVTANTGSGAVVATSENRVARREAALTKFRQKREQRCFEKKVRYQSRKRLAEQRPRVRGQFVRQSVVETIAG
eukprot:c26733_g3_i1 orf=325-3045(-)